MTGYHVLDEPKRSLYPQAVVKVKSIIPTSKGGNVLYRSSVFAMISSWISLLPPKML
ncbi:Hypothetical protein NGAL_HAMBI1146_09110 [Neorhizobium galegae bv. officinalis]|nr:Hypothetical protein NGAL_HAMBI1146_09110 [Neorhizobium galegae bv. officinalis]